jgi:hypothetical protein
MRSYLTSHLIIALYAILIAILIAGSAWYVDHSQQAIEDRLHAELEETRATLADLAVVTDRNGADALTERIIVDCPRRTEFENLLNRLGTATKKELLNAQQLFESCGAFYSERKALMVAQLEREFAHYEETLSLLAELDDVATLETDLSKWKALIEAENKRSSFLTEQTNIQSEIITLLIEGTGTQTRINELVRRAQSISESLSVTDAQIDEMRMGLM